LILLVGAVKAVRAGLGCRAQEGTGGRWPPVLEPPAGDN